MSDSYEQLCVRLRDGSAFIHLDVQPPRNAPTRQIVAHLFELAPGAPRRPQGQAISVAISPEQACALLDAGAVWSGPAHLRDEILASREH